MGLILGSHFLYFNIIYYFCLLVLHCISRQVTELTLAAIHSHRELSPTASQNFPSKYNNHSLHLKNASPVSHKNSAKPDPIFSQSLSLHPSFPQMALGLFNTFETQSSFIFPWHKISKNKLATPSSKGGVLGNMRNRRKKITYYWFNFS